MGGTVGSDGDINKQVGFVGGEESHKASSSPPAELSEPTGDVIYIELQPSVTKDSTPPTGKPEEIP